MKKILLILLIGLIFSGCDIDLFGTKEIAKLQKQNQELLREIKTKKEQKEYALSQQKLSKETELEKAKIKAKTELEKEKLKAEAELKKAELERLKQKELELIKQKTILQESKRRAELIKYGFWILAMIIIILAFFIYTYFKRRREDKLIAYNDNLKKYFIFKEQQMKMELAQNILTTIKEGTLSKEDEQKLISVLTNKTDVEKIDTDILIKYEKRDKE
jgi:hypothetical protein